MGAGVSCAAVAWLAAEHAQFSRLGKRMWLPRSRHVGRVTVSPWPTSWKQLAPRGQDVPRLLS